LTGISAKQAWAVYRRAELLHDHQAIESTLDRMAAGIHARLADREPVVVCLMNGGVIPCGRLLPRLEFPLEIDYVHATRYGAKLRGGDLHWLAGPYIAPRDRTILLVDDILDEGTTLSAIEARYRAEGAREVLKAVLVVKDRYRSLPIVADFAGVTVPDRYVFGCGMDYKGWLRNVDGIYAAHPDDERASAGQTAP